MKNLFLALDQFHRRVLGMYMPDAPQQLHPDRKAWAITAFREEVDEFESSTKIEDEADALGDLMYFAMGRFNEMGIDPGPVLDEIHRANMAKVRGELSKRPGSMGYDTRKPDGWRAPNPELRSPREKLIVIGHARHGKDTVAEMLSEHYGYRFASSSRICAERVVYPTMRDMYPDSEACYQDRHNHREHWFNMIRDLTRTDPSAVGRMVFKDHDIYCGIRNRLEFGGCRELASHVIWVDARERLPLESASSMQLEAHMADTIIHNNGTLDELKQRVDDFVMRRF